MSWRHLTDFRLGELQSPTDLSTKSRGVGTLARCRGIFNRTYAPRRKVSKPRNARQTSAHSPFGPYGLLSQ